MQKINLKSKLINISAVARLMNIRATTLYNRINGIGRHKELSALEVEQIENLIKSELYHNDTISIYKN